MYKFIQHPLGKALLVFLLLVIVFAQPAARAEADVITAIITVVVAVAFGAIGVLVFDAFSCQLNIVFDSSCGHGSGSGSSGGSSGSSISGGSNSQGGRGSGSSGSGKGSANGGGQGAACSSQAANACGMHGTGFIQGGQCNATAPANSACPAPVIGTAGFYADPALVRKGDSTKLFWKASNATSCDLTGGGLAGLLSLAIQNLTGQNTNTIDAKTVFTLTCQNGVGGPTASQQATVNLVPAYQEI